MSECGANGKLSTNETALFGPPLKDCRKKEDGRILVLSANSDVRNWKSFFEVNVFQKFLL